MAARHLLALLAASLASACAPRGEPLPVAERLPVSDSVYPRELEFVFVPKLQPAPLPPPDFAHPTLHAACMAHEGLPEVEDFPDCEVFQSGTMPDGVTRYHVVGRWWNEMDLAELLILESAGRFTRIGELGWNAPHQEQGVQVVSTRLAVVDVDDDGRDDAAFRIVERLTDASAWPVRFSKQRSARYCRVNAGKWTCTEVLERAPVASDWPP